MTYQITYTLEGQETAHCRWYRALDAATAVEMFKATCENGSLTGEHPKVKAVYKKMENEWEEVTLQVS